MKTKPVILTTKSRFAISTASILHINQKSQLHGLRTYLGLHMGRKRDYYLWGVNQNEKAKFQLERIIFTFDWNFQAVICKYEKHAI